MAKGKNTFSQGGVEAQRRSDTNYNTFKGKGPPVSNTKSKSSQQNMMSKNDSGLINLGGAADPLKQQKVNTGHGSPGITNNFYLS